MSLTNPSPRNIYGTDFVVTYVTTTEEVVITKVSKERSSSGRFTPAELCSCVGKNSKCLLFLKNNNLQDSKNGLRGALLLVNNKIGLIVHTHRTHILFQVLLPLAMSSEFLCLDLCKSQGNHGFFLQQIHGELVGVLTPQYKKTNHLYPYLVDGYLFMDPAGPHFFKGLSISAVPKKTLKCFEGEEDNLTKLSYR
jgi:hypothetical protein